MGFLYIIPCFLHTDCKQLGIVFELLLCLLVCYLLALDGMRTTPPTRNGNTNGGEEHTESMVVVEEVVVVVACADGQ